MEENEFHSLPACVQLFIEQVIRKMRYRRKARNEVQRELTDHFLDVLAGIQDPDEREQVAAEHVAAFGDPTILGKLLRRAKKRCRPLHVKVAIRTMQAAGILLLCIVGRVAYLNTGTPVIRVDYVAWMNDKVRDGRDENLNARPYYERAVQLRKDLPKELDEKMYDLSKKSPADPVWDLADAFLTEQAPAFEALREGAARPHYWNVYEAAPSNNPVPDLAAQVMGDVMRAVSAYEKLGQEFRFIQIPWLVHIGNLEKAVDDSVVLHKLARHLSGCGLLIEQLTGTGIEAMAHAATYEILSSNRLSADMLKDYQEQFLTLDKGIAVLDVEAEKGFWYDLIQRTFTDEGDGSGRPIRVGLMLAASDMPSYLKGFVAGYPDRREVTATIERYYEQVEALAGKTPWELRDAEKRGAGWESLPKQNFMLDLTLPGFQRSAEIAWRVRAQRRALPVIVAVMRYERDKGNYPSSLETLVKDGYITSIPKDPYSDDALAYRVAGSGFVLYSLGADMVDDGGELGSCQGAPQNWSEDGDWTFWPADGDWTFWPSAE